MTDFPAMNEPIPELRELAGLLGVATDFSDWQGRHVPVPAATVVAVLAALGVDASTAEGTRAALRERRAAPWRRMLAPCVVMRSGESAQLAVHVPHGEPVQVSLVTESGDELQLRQLDVYVDPADIDGRLVGRATFELPGGLPLGWHEAHARCPSNTARCSVVVTPRYLGAALGPRHGAYAPPDRVWGFMTQLYSVRSRESWGHGDLHDLAELARWSADFLGAGFILINPVHAPAPVVPLESSPYLPVTRRFVSPLYLRVEDIEEWADLDPIARAQVEQSVRPLRDGNMVDALLDRDAVWQAKSAALTLVHAVPRSAARQAAYDAFRMEQGPGLIDFATWCALAESYGPQTSGWPEELRDPRSDATRAAQEAAGFTERIDFYCWLQWLADEQLEAAQRIATNAGMPLGIMHDLAVGVHPDGADSWALGDVLAHGVTVGAPPDAFNQQGQDWSQPPWRPDALADTSYAPFRDMIRTILRHAGGIRVDHILGLFRLWWVPAGASPAEGTYVRYDHDALVGILALEAHRAGALVVGEDLGTVEPWVRDYLADRGILGTSILWFERDQQGRPLPPEHWRELCLATLTTHDLPPTAGYLAGEHVRLRSELGLLTRSVEEEALADAREREEWLALMRSRGLLADDAGEQEVVEALHSLLRAAPSRLLGVALSDATGDRRTMNQPGTSDEYPNWRLPLADPEGRPVLLEELFTSPRAAALAATMSAPDGA